MLKRVNCGSREAGKHNNYLCLTLWHTFLLFIFLFLKSEWNSSLVGSLSDCQTFQWSHLKVPFFFFSNMWAIFIISVQQWPLEFQDHFLSPSWCPHKRPRSTNIWGASLHLHICWHRRWRPLVDYKSRCCAEGQTHRLWEMGGRSKTWFLVSGLFGSPWKTRHFCEWRAEWGLVWRVRQEFAFRVLHLIPFLFYPSEQFILSI